MVSFHGLKTNVSKVTRWGFFFDKHEMVVSSCCNVSDKRDCKWCGAHEWRNRNRNPGDVTATRGKIGLCDLCGDASQSRAPVSSCMRKEADSAVP